MIGTILQIFGIIFIILIILSAILFFICFCGENGRNKKCANANACAASVRCNAESKDNMDCFREKL